MSDRRLRELERVYQATGTEAALIAWLLARIRAGTLTDRRALALVTKPPVRCWGFTGTTPSLGLEIPPTALRPRAYPELGGEWEFALLPGKRHENNLPLTAVWFEDATTGERLGGREFNPLWLNVAYSYRFTWEFNEDSPSGSEALP